MKAKHTERKGKGMSGQSSEIFKMAGNTREAVNERERWLIAQRWT